MDHNPFLEATTGVLQSIPTLDELREASARAIQRCLQRRASQIASGEYLAAHVSALTADQYRTVGLRTKYRLVKSQYEWERTSDAREVALWYWGKLEAETFFEPIEYLGGE